MSTISFYFEKELNLEIISDCFKKSFNKEFDKNYWKWRFLNNPVSDKIYISYLKENEILISYYAVTPCILEIKGKGKFKVALSNMTMTHPNFQGKGYFKTLANELYKILKHDGFIGVYGFANSSSHYGFRKYLNWIDLSILNIFKVNSNLFRSFLLKDKEAFDFETSKSDCVSVSLVKTMVCNTSKILLSRDEDVLLWRLVHNPSQQYYVLTIKKGTIPVGLIFYKFFNEDIDIMEYFYAPNEHTERFNILGAGLDYLLKKSREFVNIWSNVYTEEHLYLEKLGFFESCFNSYFGVIPFIQNKELMNVENWHCRFIDSDIF